MKTVFSIVSFLLGSFALVAQRDYSLAAVNYLKDQQYQTTDSNLFQFGGEWPSYMQLENRFILLGSKGKKFEDSNLFTLGTIHNILCRVYLQDTNNYMVKGMIDLAYPRIESFKNGSRYNFWNLLAPQISINKFRSADDQKFVRRPTNFPLKNRFINKAANVVEDADDTALGLLAEFYHQKINGSSDSISVDVASIFDQYRDVNRHNRHWYNHVHGFENNTGAYLTWHAKEYQFRSWNPFKELFHNAFHFLPFSKNYPFMEKPYLPYGTNDIDAVVNGNILQLFAILGIEGKGVEKSIKYLKGKVEKEKFDIAASYYPNRYATPYSISQAYAAGQGELGDAMSDVCQFVSSNQDEDGGWSSRLKVNQGDRIQSTVYALGTLLNADHKLREVYLCEIEKGMSYLLDNAIWVDDEVHWEGGVFFSGGSIIRTSLFWTSDALTTAMIFELLQKHARYFKKDETKQLVEFN